MTNKGRLWCPGQGGLGSEGREPVWCRPAGFRITRTGDTWSLQKSAQCCFQSMDQLRLAPGFRLGEKRLELGAQRFMALTEMLGAARE